MNQQCDSSGSVCPLIRTLHSSSLVLCRPPRASSPYLLFLSTVVVVTILLAARISVCALLARVPLSLCTAVVANCIVPLSATVPGSLYSRYAPVPVGVPSSKAYVLLVIGFGGASLCAALYVCLFLPISYLGFLVLTYPRIALWSVFIPVHSVFCALPTGSRAFMFWTLRSVFIF